MKLDDLNLLKKMRTAIFGDYEEDMRAMFGDDQEFDNIKSTRGVSKKTNNSSEQVLFTKKKNYNEQRTSKSPVSEETEKKQSVKEVSVRQMNISSQDSSTRVSKPKVTNKKAASKKIKINKKDVVIFATASAVAIAGYTLYRQRKPYVNDVTNKAIVSYVSDDTSLDEIIKLYNMNLDGNAKNNSQIAYVLSDEDNVVAAIDKISQYIEISDRLEDYNLDEVLSTNSGFKDLSEEEKTKIASLTKAELLSLMDNFEEMGKVNYEEFSNEAIEYCKLARNLDYAEKIINVQLRKYGSKFLSEYPYLIIQSKIIDETKLDVSKYSQLVVKNKLDDKKCQICYYEPSLGCYYNVDVFDNYLKNISEEAEFFDNYYKYSDEVTFAKFKKKAKKAIDDYKIVILKDYDLKTTGTKETLSHQIDAETSNHEVRQKILELK